MTYYHHFRGEYDSAMETVYTRRQEIIDRARQLQPDNVDELLEASEYGEIDIELNWVDVPNPWRATDGDTISVRPVLGIAPGREDAEREKDRSDKGVWRLSLETRLPSGEEWYLGDIMFFYSNGKLQYEPDIALNTSPTKDSWASQSIGIVPTPNCFLAWRRRLWPLSKPESYYQRAV